MRKAIFAALAAVFVASQAFAGLRIAEHFPIPTSGAGGEIITSFASDDEVMITVKPTDLAAIAHYGVRFRFNPDDYEFVRAEHASVFRVEAGELAIANSRVFSGQPDAEEMSIVLRRLGSEWGRLEPQGLDVFTRNRERRVYEPAPAFTPNPASAEPKKFDLAQNYPNPFNPETEIGYTMPSDGTLELAVYNLLGQKVVTLVDGQATAGEHIATWDGTDDAGQPVSAGVYFCQLRAGGQTAVSKMILAK